MHTGAVGEVPAIEPRPLDPDDRRDVPPLPVRHLAAEAIPPELLQQDVLGRMDVQSPSVTEIDSEAARELTIVQGGPPATNRSTFSCVAWWMRFVLVRVRMARRTASAST